MANRRRAHDEARTNATTACRLEASGWQVHPGVVGNEGLVDLRVDVRDRHRGAGDDALTMANGARDVAARRMRSRPDVRRDQLDSIERGC